MTPKQIAEIQDFRKITTEVAADTESWLYWEALQRLLRTPLLSQPRCREEVKSESGSPVQLSPGLPIRGVLCSLSRYLGLGFTAHKLGSAIISIKAAGFDILPH